MKLHTVPCPGQAHSEAFIDACNLCAPLWGRVVVPEDCPDLETYRERYGNDPVKPSERKAYIKQHQALHSFFTDLSVEDGTLWSGAEARDTLVNELLKRFKVRGI